MTLIENVNNKYLNTNINNLKVFEFTKWFSEIFKNKKYKIGTIKKDKNIINVSIIDKNDTINLFKVEFLEEDSLIKKINLIPNYNYLIIKNDKFLNSLFE